MHVTAAVAEATCNPMRHQEGVLCLEGMASGVKVMDRGARYYMAMCVQVN